MVSGKQYVVKSSRDRRSSRRQTEAPPGDRLKQGHNMWLREQRVCRVGSWRSTTRVEQERRQLEQMDSRLALWHKRPCRLPILRNYTCTLRRGPFTSPWRSTSGSQERAMAGREAPTSAEEPLMAAPQPWSTAATARSIPTLETSQNDDRTCQGSP